MQIDLIAWNIKYIVELMNDIETVLIHNGTYNKLGTISEYNKDSLLIMLNTGEMVRIYDDDIIDYELTGNYISIEII